MRDVEDVNFRKTLTETIKREEGMVRLKRRLHAAEVSAQLALVVAVILVAVGISGARIWLNLCPVPLRFVGTHDIPCFELGMHGAPLTNNFRGHGNV